MKLKWNMNLVKAQRKKLIGVLAGAAVGAGGWYWYNTAAQDPQSATLRPVAVTRGTIEEVVTAQGKLEPKQYVDVGTQVSGQLKKIYIDIDNTIKQNQLLTKIDPHIYQNQIETNE